MFLYYFACQHNDAQSRDMASTAVGFENRLSEHEEKIIKAMLLSFLARSRRTTNICDLELLVGTHTSSKGDGN